MRIRDCGAGDLGAVLALLKRAKATVGFLPDQAVRERIAAGTLLVAVDDDDTVVGYLLFDLPRSDVTIRQLVVASTCRSHGVARALVDELVARYEDTRRGIGLTCRRDFEATRVWERLDFTPLGERPGRGKRQTTLTFWWRSFNQPDLFSLMHDEDERVLAVIDTNLVIQAAGQDRLILDRLFSDWMTEAVRIDIAPHTLVELNNNDDKTLREANLKYARGLELVRFQQSAANQMEQTLRDELGPSLSDRHAGDIKLSAQAAAGGARWFVTEDGEFRRPCGAAVRAVLGVEVLSSADLVLAADRSLRHDPYSVRELLGTDITVRAVAPGESDELARTFLNQREGESLKQWRKVLADHVSRVESTDAFVFCDATAPLALAVIERGSVLESPICRVANVDAEPTLGRHLLGWLRERCVESGGVAVKITDTSPGRWFDYAREIEGYLLEPQPIAVPASGVGTISDLVTRLRSEPIRGNLDSRHADDLAALAPTPEAASSIEAAFHPYVVTGAGLRTVRVPISPAYASQLFDHSLSEGQLFARDRSVALAREQVYFRTPNVQALFEPPTRLLWQVTGNALYGGATLRGWSLLGDSVVGDVDHLIERFSRFGVLDESEIRSYSKQGKVMALRFSHTHVFTQPVTLDQYRGLMRELEPGKGLSHAGPQPVTEEMFVRLLDLGG